MKKLLIAVFFVSISSLVAAAGHEVTTPPGDPKKEQQAKPTFTLAKGYFSLFNIMSTPAPQPDTAKVVPPPAIVAPEVKKK